MQKRPQPHQREDAYSPAQNRRRFRPSPQRHHGGVEHLYQLRHTAKHQLRNIDDFLRLKIGFGQRQVIDQRVELKRRRERGQQRKRSQKERAASQNLLETPLRGNAFPRAPPFPHGGEGQRAQPREKPREKQRLKSTRQAQKENEQSQHAQPQRALHKREEQRRLLFPARKNPRANPSRNGKDRAEEKNPPQRAERKQKLQGRKRFMRIRIAQQDQQHPPQRGSPQKHRFARRFTAHKSRSFRPRTTKPSHAKAARQESARSAPAKSAARPTYRAIPTPQVCPLLSSTTRR